MASDKAPQEPVAKLSVPTANSPLVEWLNYLEQLHPTEIDMGLARVSRVAQDAKVTSPARYVITVAGTNGKGTTVTYLRNILQQAGYKVGVYTSPHLNDYRERVTINGEWLTSELHSEAFAAINSARQHTSLTYFEFGTLAALWLLKQQQVDVALLEVGLGGRLDAVNVVDADVTVVTSIGIDHISFLGDNREQIGREKAGIARADKPLICGDQQPPHSIKQVASEIGAKLFQVGRQFSYKEHATSWHYHGIESNLMNLPLPKLPLMNAATALAAIEALPFAVSESAITTGLAQAQLDGRLQQQYYRDCDVVLDVAHNPQAADYVAGQLRKRVGKRPIYAVVGMLADKDYEQVLKSIDAIAERWFLATLSEPRGCQAGVLASSQAIQQSDSEVNIYDSVEQAFQAAVTAATETQKSSENPLVFVMGSFYTVGRVNHVIRSECG